MKDIKKLIKRLMDEDFRLLKKKGEDYSENNDALSNFKGYGFLAFLVLIDIKIRRLKNLLSKNANPNFESIIDTLRDIRNYCYLARCWMKKNTLPVDERNIYISTLMDYDLELINPTENFFQKDIKHLLDMMSYLSDSFQKIPFSEDYWDVLAYMFRQIIFAAYWLELILEKEVCNEN